MAQKRFLVAIPQEDGGVELYPMKEWLRRNPDHTPGGLDATNSNSHSLRNALRKAGWGYQESEAEVRLVYPGTHLDAVLGDTDEAGPDEEPGTAFSLEYQLRDFLADNLASIDVGGRRLKLYVDDRGVDGIEYPTAVGRIDILAVDDEGNFYVFELKRARSPDAAMGQVARYMGWVSHTVGRGREVKGIIVAKEIAESLRYGSLVMKEISLFEYEVSFSLKRVKAVQETVRPVV